MSAVDYLQKIQGLIGKLETDSIAAIEAAAQSMANSIAAGHVVYYFGSGHSVIPALDVFPRYGSFVGLQPVHDSWSCGPTSSAQAARPSCSGSSARRAIWQMCSGTIHWTPRHTYRHLPRRPQRCAGGGRPHRQGTSPDGGGHHLTAESPPGDPTPLLGQGPGRRRQHRDRQRRTARGLADPHSRLAGAGRSLLDRHRAGDFDGPGGRKPAPPGRAGYPRADFRVTERHARPGPQPQGLRDVPGATEGRSSRWSHSTISTPCSPSWNSGAHAGRNPPPGSGAPCRCHCGRPPDLRLWHGHAGIIAEEMFDPRGHPNARSAPSWPGLSPQVRPLHWALNWSGCPVWPPACWTPAGVTANDVLIVHSNSGRNTVAIEVAAGAAPRVSPSWRSPASRTARPSRHATPRGASSWTWPIT